MNGELWNGRCQSTCSGGLTKVGLECGELVYENGGEGLQKVVVRLVVKEGWRELAKCHLSTFSIPCFKATHL